MGRTSTVNNTLSNDSSHFVCTSCNVMKSRSEFLSRKGTDRPKFTCRECRSVKAREYYSRDPKKHNAESRMYYAKDLELSRKKSKERYEINKETWREWHREYYKNNAPRLLRRHKEYYENNKEVISARNRAYRKAHPEIHALHQRKRRSLLAEVICVDFTIDQLAQRMAYFGNRCWMCKEEFEHVDHVKPLSKGGSHMLSNLRPACSRCNLMKHGKWPFVCFIPTYEWRRAMLLFIGSNVEKTISTSTSGGA